MKILKFELPLQLDLQYAEPASQRLSTTLLNKNSFVMNEKLYHYSSFFT